MQHGSYDEHFISIISFLKTITYESSLQKGKFVLWVNICVHVKILFSSLIDEGPSTVFEECLRGNFYIHKQFDGLLG